MTASSEASLYERLGGYDAIAAVIDEFLSRLFNDPRISDYWKGQNDDHKLKERQLIVDFMCAAAGGPAFYTGKDMKTSHLGLGISETDYDIMLSHCLATLEKFELAEKEKNDVCSFLDGLRSQIVATK